MLKWKAMAAGLSAMAVGGCILPVERMIAQSLDVRIVDARTGNGVSGAEVTLMPDSRFEGAAPKQATSGPDGRVRIDAIAKTEWIMPLPIDMFYFQAAIRVEAEGYETYEGPAHAGATGSRPEPEPGRIVSLTPAGGS